MSGAVEKWLAENTFECPVGRVSPAQCERNRGKPSFKEFYRKYPNLKGPKEGFQPEVCEACRDWERLIREFEQRRNEMSRKNKTGVSKVKPFSERKNVRVQVDFRGREEAPAGEAGK